MTTFAPSGYVLPNGDGQGIWFLGTLMTVKAGHAQTHGAFTLLEQLFQVVPASVRRQIDGAGQDKLYAALERILEICSPEDLTF